MKSSASLICLSYMAKVSNDKASHHFKCSASLFCECVRVIISDQLLMEHQTFSFLKEKPSNRKHVLVHRWIKIKISYTEDVTLQRFNEETEVTVADNLQATTGSLFPGTENDGDCFKKKKKKAWLTKMKLPGDRVEEKKRWREGKWDTFILCD